MLQDKKTIYNRHLNFIKKICNTNIVYALENDDGFATSWSDEFEDEYGDPAGIICFWAEEARAKSCIADEWNDYHLKEIKLPDFVENWCIGMHNDGMIAGTSFDKNLFGYEMEPLGLILEIANELKKQNLKMSLRKFSSIEDLEEKVKIILHEKKS